MLPFRNMPAPVRNMGGEGGTTAWTCCRVLSRGEKGQEDRSSRMSFLCAGRPVRQGCT